MNRKTPKHFTISILAVCVLALAAMANDAEPATFRTVLDHYEAVRSALVTDTVDDSAEPAQAIEAGLSGLHHDFDATAAAVDRGSAARALDLLGKMHVAATALAQATEAGDLEATRSAFYELSKPMVQYRELMTGDKPVVAYCPMERKSWLQEDDAIGNPYAGQSMPTCGSVVSGGSSGGR